MALRLLDPTGQSVTSDAIQQVENNRKLEAILNTDLQLTVLKAAYPVGGLYISTLSTNPSTLLGFGTWSAFGAGRVLVSLDSGQVEFDTVEETGGEKTHVLTTAELAAHTHGPGSLTTDGRTLEWKNTNTLGGSSTVVTDLDNLTGATAPDGTAAHSHAVTGGVTASNGSDTAHNNLQPYITVYMWKRTA